MFKTFQEWLLLVRLLLTNVRSTIELAPPLVYVGVLRILRGTTSSVAIASSNTFPRALVNLLPQSTAQELKSPAIATGKYCLASSVSRSRNSENCSIERLGGA
ncbi:hypothetical protein EVAR_47933_1 [Eumeta japonica]|uniref:Secreted protein n=1 Tax=Eumeta variegata TaxID=151549 RepID=A0A4C1Y4X1_EUMVA|nr:hypothetical protein EVAR_47933_1 [Eumeta japonica]